ncbi:MAG: nucleoporin [Planctomycetota bacterium]
MKTRPPQRAHASESGAALLMSLLVLLVLAALAFQISVTATTDARTARNDVNLTTMDLACESALLEVSEKLATDGEGGSDAAGAGAGAATDPTAQPGANAGQDGAQNPAGGAGAQNQQAVDSRRDEWASPQRTEINEIKLRIFVQDEDSKYNVLNLLNPDEKEAEAAFNRVARILDLCREGTTADIDERVAQDMTRAMLDYMVKRKQSSFPRPRLLTDVEKEEDRCMPLTLREFAVLKPFDESMFRDFRDEDGKVVHSIESFLTVWSSLETVAEMQSNQTPTAQASGAANSKTNTSNTNTQSKSGQTGAQTQAQTGASGANGVKNKSETNGFAVNPNTAPAAVLKGLFDDREVPGRFWDKVIEYRNLEEEKEEGETKTEEEENPEDAPLDEYGRPVIKRRIFEQLSELQELDGWDRLLPAAQEKLNQLLTTQSQVFTIYIVARKSTAVEGDTSEPPESAEEMRAEEEKGDSLMRVVRSVVWRTKKDDKVVLVPIVRWEVLDYLPHEVIDFPDEER